MQMSGYRLTLVSPLPSIDASRIVLEAVVPTRIVPFVQHTLFQRYRHVIIGLYLLAMLPVAIFPFLPESSWNSTASYVVYMSPLIATPLALMIYLEARVEVVFLSVTTYDFWFLHAVIAVFEISTALYLQTPRLGFVFISWFLCGVGTIIDALHLIAVHELLLPLVMVGATTPFLLKTLTNTLPNANNVVVLQFPNLALDARELIINCLLTLCVYSFRLSYLYYKTRSRSTNKSEDKTQSGQFTFARIRSISYRCRIQWQTEAINQSIVPA